jgi:hypothetical protein
MGDSDKDILSRKDIENMIEATVARKMESYDLNYQQPRHRENQQAIGELREAVAKARGFYAAILLASSAAVTIILHFWK